MSAVEFVTVDSRGRISLSKYGKHTTYIVTVEPNGTIVLEPAVIVRASSVGDLPAETGVDTAVQTP